jgi:serine/threonine-protein kinase RsbW
MNTETQTFPANLDSLEPIRDFITEKCNSVGMDRKKSYAICLAIDELATNIVNHGYSMMGPPSDPNNKIDVIISTEDDQMMVILEDNAIQFNPLTHIAPDEEELNKPLEEREIGGLGIMLAIKNVDDFKYVYVDNKNRNILIMKLH